MNADEKTRLVMDAVRATGEANPLEAKIIEIVLTEVFMALDSLVSIEKSLSAIAEAQTKIANAMLETRS